MPSLVGSEMCIRDRDTLEAVRYLGRHRPAVKPSGLLEIGELRYLHAVEPDFPPEAPGPEGGRFPVVLHEPYVVFAVSYTHLRAHETRHDLVCRLLLEKKKKQ